MDPVPEKAAPPNLRPQTLESVFELLREGVSSRRM